MENANQQDNYSTSEIENFLKRRLGDKEGDDMMHYIKSEIDRIASDRIKSIREANDQWRSALKENFASKEDALDLKKRLIKRVSAAEGTIILWGFVFWITLIIAFYILNRFLL